MSKKYDREFKMEAVRLADKSDNSSLIEKNLNIGSGCIYRWRRELQNNDFSNTDKTQSNANNIKLKQLERENKRLRMERDILKKAVHIFTTEPDRYSGL